jgi:hypothetical protein
LLSLSDCTLRAQTVGPTSFSIDSSSSSAY